MKTCPAIFFWSKQVIRQPRFKAGEIDAGGKSGKITLQKNGRKCHMHSASLPVHSICIAEIDVRGGPAKTNNNKTTKLLPTRSECSSLI